MEKFSKIAESGIPTPVAVDSAPIEKKDLSVEIKVYKKRWFMLFLFILHSICVSCQLTQYTIIANIIMRYYNVTSFEVHATALISMLYYIILIFPVTYLLKKISLKKSLVLGSLLCCVGSWIKILSCSPDRFLITLLGHSVMALSVVMMLPIPGQLAAHWFSSDEVSKATSIGLLGQLLGMALSFLLPPLLVKNHENIDDIGKDLNLMFWSIAVASTLSLLLIVPFFQSDPKLPPSKARAFQQDHSVKEQQSFGKSIKNILTNRNFMILCHSYGLILGVQASAGTIFNQLFMVHFKDGERDAGIIGSIMTFIGMPGSILFGIILDRTHKFKELAVISYAATIAFQVLNATSIVNASLPMVHVTTILLGLAMSGFVTIGYETAAEFTYPESQTLSSGILNITNNFYGIVLVLLQEQIFERFGDIYVHATFSVILVIGLILTLMMKNDHRRQAAQKNDELHVQDPSSDKVQTKHNGLNV
ncbi:hypothetical protein QAD02_010024 [Eretmocerus hayati]|uniref:Uncharacterized protein n=1 Tax=Eretmocerus hayati TaxID=131215 RepID=A0ACC2NBB7_9HYME|nr:hypothetical protein QAD02_010024 [Eretmocerus hayati]